MRSIERWVSHMGSVKKDDPSLCSLALCICQGSHAVFFLYLLLNKNRGTS